LRFAPGDARGAEAHWWQWSRGTGTEYAPKMHAVFQVCLKCFSQHGYQIDLLWEVSFRVQACLFLAFVGSAAVQKSTFKWWIPSKSKLPFIARTFINQ